jgi:hypothetical protein
MAEIANIDELKVVTLLPWKRRPEQAALVPDGDGGIIKPLLPVHTDGSVLQRPLAPYIDVEFVEAVLSAAFLPPGWAASGRLWAYKAYLQVPEVEYGVLVDVYV